MGILGTREDQSDELVSVVFPTINRGTTLAEVLGAVVDESGPCFRPPYQEIAREAAARQKGIEEARGESVVPRHDDVTADPGSSEGRPRPDACRRRRLALGYMPTDVQLTRGPGPASVIRSTEDRATVCNAYKNDPASLSPHLWGGNLSLRRSDAFGIDGSMKDVLPYHADIGFGIRRREAGIDAIVDRKRLASHSHSRNLPQLAAGAHRDGAAGTKPIERRPEGIFHNPLEGFPVSERVRTRVRCAELMHPFSAPLTMMISLGAGRLGAWKTEVLFARIIRHVEMTSSFRKAQRANKP
jgi:hypothetical protein